MMGMSKNAYRKMSIWLAYRGSCEYIYKYKDNLTEQSPQRVYGHEDCYVERALERLTVTTMMLCRDSALGVLVEKARFGGPFRLF